MMLDARIKQLVSSIKRTRYQHTTEIDEREGTVYCDCSGLVGYVLRHHFPEAYLALRGSEAPWRKRPLAVTYYQTFVAANGDHPAGAWRSIARMLDARPGDVLAWRKRTIKQGETTGHTCMIAGKPELIAPGLVRVQVIDSSRRPQALDRQAAGKDGVGWALKTFLIDDFGKPKGYLVGERPVKAGVALGRMVSVRSESRSVLSGVDETVAENGGREVQTYHGKTKEEAVRIAQSRELAWRIIRENGEPRPVGWKIRGDRLNFVLVDGRVSEVIRG